MTSRTFPASLPVSLRRLFPDASFVGCAEIAVSVATDRSAECVPGCLFAALPGTKLQGRDFVPEAICRGASAILTPTPLPEVPLPQCIVSDARTAYAQLCHALAGWPTRRLGVAGVTGTNGKTSTAWLIRSMLAEAGYKTGLLGTIEYHDGEKSTPATLTTPDAKTLSTWLGSTLANGGNFAAVELSSHALDQGRAAGLLLDVAIVTNITHDHLDYHASAEEYRAAKARIAGLLKPGGCLVLNADDPGGRSLLDRTPDRCQARTFGIEQPADVIAADIRESADGVQFLLRTSVDQVEISTSLLGRHGVANCLAAACAGLHFGLSLEQIASGIAALSCVPGRLQRIDGGQPFQVFIDYAHTDDALRRVIAAVRSVTPGRVLCVFGAGGDRDRTKRAPMGAAASTADVAIVTSDNPRSEDPQSIMYDILAGCTSPAMHVDPDREQAIHWALQHAAPEDSVIVAGKGHETVQIVGHRKFPFDDAQVCREWLAQHGAALSRHRERQPA